MQRSAVIVFTVGTMLLAAPAALAQDPSQPAVVRDGNQWFLREALSGGDATTVFVYGRPGDRPLLCDWDGDGRSSPGVVRSAEKNLVWFVRDTNSGGTADVAFKYGRPGDQPVCGDWDGDGSETPGIVRRRSSGDLEWHLRDVVAGGAADRSYTYGVDPDHELPPTWAVVGDWDGDGVDTAGVVDGTEDGGMQWLLRDSHTSGAADHTFLFHSGARWGDDMERHVPVVGDWNGDGADGVGVTTAADAASPQWRLRDDLSDGPADHVFRYGRHMDLALPW